MSFKLTNLYIFPNLQLEVFRSMYNYGRLDRTPEDEVSGNNQRAKHEFVARL